MLENVRFEPGETKNDPELAQRYAALADVYVNDAFGAAHRAHASTEAVAHLLPSAAGRLLEREVATLQRDPRGPAAAARGGRRRRQGDGQDRRARRVPPARRPGAHRRRDVLPVLQGAGPRRRRLAVRGGGPRARAAGARGGGEKLRLPTDLVAGREFAADTETRELDGVDVPDGWMGLDIGRAQRVRLRRGDRRRRHGVLERPDGRVRARAVRGRHAHGRRGGGRDRRRHGRRRRRLRRRAGAVRARRPRRPPLDRRRRVARADRGQGAAGRGGAVDEPRRRSSPATGR